MKLTEVWIEYACARLGTRAKSIKSRAVTPWQAMELFFDWHPILSEQSEAAKAVSYNTAFDDEADAALCLLAQDDSFAGWAGLSAGAWRVIWERLIYAEAVVLTNEILGSGIIAYLPQGMDRRSRSRALGLMYLLGGARTIDRRLLATSPPGTLPSFPASTPLRQQ